MFQNQIELTLLYAVLSAARLPPQGRRDASCRVSFYCKFPQMSNGKNKQKRIYHRKTGALFQHRVIFVYKSETKFAIASWAFACARIVHCGVGLQQVSGGASPIHQPRPPAPRYWRYNREIH